MALNIVEFFGYDPSDNSQSAFQCRKELKCPFLRSECKKKFSDGEISGACTVKQSSPEHIICCPQRLYAEEHKILVDVVQEAFGERLHIYPGLEAIKHCSQGRVVAAFGKGWGHELRLPNRRKKGGYFVDWILAVIDAKGKLSEFVAVEVQTIDTTGTYRRERDAYISGKEFDGASKAGLNWENVSKRILPQLIYKGHVLRREELCKKGMFFVCPSAVYRRIIERLGGALDQYHMQPGTLTFRWYDPAPSASAGQIRKLQCGGSHTTTIDRIAHAFTSPSNLPESGVYESAIRNALKLTV